MTNKAKQFKTKPRATQVVEFDIDDDHFTFTAPKMANTILPVLQGANEMEFVRAVLNWLSEGLPQEQNNRLIERLTDSQDDFDIDDLEPVYEYLMTEVTKRPTKPR